MSDWTRKNVEKAEQWANMTLSKTLREADRDDDEDRLDSEQLEDVRNCLAIIDHAHSIRHRMAMPEPAHHATTRA